MPIEDTLGLSSESPPDANTEPVQSDTNRHFGDVFSAYRSVRDLDLAAVRLVTDVLTSAAAQARPFRLLDVGTGTGRYLEMVSKHLSTTLAADICPMGLDRSPAMVGQARRLNGSAYPAASHLVGAVETLPFRAASCDAITSFNAVHHFDLARFVSEASRVLTPSGFLVLYTRTAEQNRDTVWGRYFPEFATLETRLHAASAFRRALDATHAFTSVRVQSIPWRVTTSLSRLVEQVAAYHYSTFRFYSPSGLQTALDTFQTRVRDVFGDSSHITFDNDHLLVVAQRAASV
jgi:ubiquinone/menaquinone biosynthesis C-methylase UbiE